MWIGQKKFEQLDEILVMHVAPMMEFAEMIYKHKYFKNDSKREDVERYLKEQKAKDPRVSLFIYLFYFIILQ